MKREKKYTAADALTDQLISAEYEHKNRPKGRERNITGEGEGVSRRGEGLGTGPVGQGLRPRGAFGTAKPDDVPNRNVTKKNKKRM